MRTFGRLVLGLLVTALVACGSTASRSEETPAPTRVTPWSMTDMQGARHDVAAEFAAGRSVALVFWQSW